MHYGRTLIKKTDWDQSDIFGSEIFAINIDMKSQKDQYLKKVQGNEFNPNWRQCIKYIFSNTNFCCFKIIHIRTDEKEKRRIFFCSYMKICLIKKCSEFFPQKFIRNRTKSIEVSTVFFAYIIHYHWRNRFYHAFRWKIVCIHLKLRIHYSMHIDCELCFSFICFSRQFNININKMSLEQHFRWLRFHLCVSEFVVVMNLLSFRHLHCVMHKLSFSLLAASPLGDQAFGADDIVHNGFVCRLILLHRCLCLITVYASEQRRHFNNQTCDSSCDLHWNVGTSFHVWLSDSRFDEITPLHFLRPNYWHQCAFCKI